MATRNFGQIAAFIEADVPPSNVKVLFRATGVNGSWPVGLYIHNGSAWVPLNTTTNVAVTNANVAVNFRLGNLAYRGTPSGNITVSADLTGAVDYQVRTMYLVGNGTNTVTFSNDFKFLLGSQNYNNQNGIVNIVTMRYVVGVGILTEIAYA